MIVYLVMEKCRNYDQTRAAYIKEEDADIECDRLDKTLPNSDGFYIDTLEVKE